MLVWVCAWVCAWVWANWVGDGVGDGREKGKEVVGGCLSRLRGMIGDEEGVDCGWFVGGIGGVFWMVC